MVSATLAFTQSSSDFHKLEVYGGYSLASVESNSAGWNVLFAGGGGIQLPDLCSSSSTNALGANFQRGYFCSRRNFNGFDGSVTYNVSRYFGIKGDVTGHFKSGQFVDTVGGVTFTIDTKDRLYNFLGGVQVKDNATKARLKPFGHALFGAARYSARLQQVATVAAANYILEDSDTSFAMKLGGGLDVRVNDRIDIRLIELDYNPEFAGDRALTRVQGPYTVSTTGKTAHNFTIGFGIVIH